MVGLGWGRKLGKASVVRRGMGEGGVIVVAVAGTRRDAIETRLTTHEQKFRVMDTAGIRRKGKTGEMAEKRSVVMAMKSLARADVAIRRAPPITPAFAA